MKKFLLFLTLLVSAIGLTHAAVQKTDVITRNSFTTTSKEYAEDKCNGSETGEAAQYTAGIYFGTKDFMQFKNGAYGIWVNKTPGKLVSIQIVFNGTPNFSSKKACNVYGNTSVYNAAAKVPAGDLIQTITTAASSTVTVDFTNGTQDYVAFYISSVDGAKYITQLSVTWEIAGTGGEGPTLTDPEITWKKGETVLEEGYEVEATLDSDSNVFPTLNFADGAGAHVTCSSSNEAVATVTDDGSVTIHAAGTTTITASTRANDATYKQASKSYTLTVIDPSNPTYTYTIVVADITGLTSGNAIGTFTFNSITFSSSGAKYYNSSTPYTIRMYNGNTMSIKAPDGYYIQKIELTSTEGNLTEFTASTNGTLTTANKILTWTLNDGAVTSQTVEIKNAAASSNTTKFSKFVVYCAKDSNLKDAEFAFTSTTVNKWIDDEPFTNTLNYADGITYGIVYSIENPADATVAEINETTGEVTIIGVGTAKITATRPEDETFKKGEASYTLVVSKHPHGLAYTPSSVTLEPGEELTEQPTLKNDNTLVVTYSSSNEAVATVTDDGTISLAGATGQAVISATFKGNDTYEAGVAYFIITVRDKVYADATYTLVKDVNTIEPGDVVVIAANGYVMQNSYKEGNRPAIAGIFSEDKTYLYGAADVLRLMVLKTVDGYFMFQTENYEKTNGFLGSTNSTSSNALKVLEGISDYTMATVTITEAGVATIKFHKGADPDPDGDRNNLQLNGGLFNCYGTSNYTAVSIYKATSHPTTIYDTDKIAQTFVETADNKNNEVKLTYDILTESKVSKFAIQINGVTTDIVNNNDGLIEIALTGVPYLPDAEITICPVLAEDAEGNPTTLGHPETLNFTWANINSYGAVELDNTLVWIGSDADPLPKEATLGAISYFGIDVKVANLNYYVDVEAKNQSTGDVYNGEFAWCEGGFSYAVNPYIEGVPVDTQNKSLDFSKYTKGFPTIEFSITPIYKFDVAEQYRSLVPAPATPRPARVASSTITDGVQTVVCDAKTAKSVFSATSDVSGVEGVTVDANAPVEFFNLQGVRVDGALAPGIYIRRQGQAVSKVRIN